MLSQDINVQYAEEQSLMMNVWNSVFVLNVMETMNIVWIICLLMNMFISNHITLIPYKKKQNEIGLIRYYETFMVGILNWCKALLEGHVVLFCVPNED